MKRILVCTDGSCFSQSSYQYAAWLAPRLQASIEVLFVSDIRAQKAVSTGDFSATLGIDASRELLNQLVDLEHEKARINHHKAQLTLQAAAQFFTKQGISEVKLTHHTGFLVDSFHEFEAQADLVILGKRGENAEFASGHLGANVERVLRSSSKPSFVTSRNYQPINRILLADDGGKSCQKALEFLITSPAFKGLELHLLTVAKKPGDEAAQAYLKTAEHQVKAGGFIPICQLIQGNPEQEIARYVEAQNINLLIMGAYGHSRIRHLVIGSTTAQILRGSHIPVLLFR
ncbi:universal stress protein [Anabaena sp. PCC 7108]|uniref:universal stress protein n=1 Tax=Anabaena sp. PCC 7108 TaxID=163908 RepID=UPI000347FDDE|nr:universal stress protein [Anabaena sp. PCC 7108]